MSRQSGEKESREPFDWVKLLNSDSDPDPATFTPGRRSSFRIPAYAIFTPVIALAGIAAVIARPWERFIQASTEKTQTADSTSPQVTAEPTSRARPTPTPTEFQVASGLVGARVKNSILFGEDGQPRDKDSVYALSRAHIASQLRFIGQWRLISPDTGEITTAEVGGHQYDLTNPTQLILASSLLEGSIRSQFIGRHDYPFPEIYLNDLPKLRDNMSLDIEGTVPAVDLAILHSLYQTSETLQRYGKPTPRLGIIAGGQGIAQYRPETGEIVFSTYSNNTDFRGQASPDRYSWARAFGAFYRANNPQLLDEYSQAIKTVIAGNRTRITKPDYTLIVDRPLSPHIEEDFDASVGYYLNEGYEFRRTIGYLRYRGYNAEADVWQTRYDVLRSHFGFETSAHGKEYTPVQLKVGGYYRIVDFLPELGDTIFVRKDPTLNPNPPGDRPYLETYPQFYVRDRDLVQVVGEPVYYADDVDRLLYPLVPVTPVTETVIGSSVLRSTTPTKENIGYLKGTDWLVAAD